MVSVDRVRLAREQAPAREVQRLAIDLDDARVALRFHGDDVAVKVVSDPSGTLGAGWARQVERTLDSATRAAGDGAATMQRETDPKSGSQHGRSRREQPPSPQPDERSVFALHLDAEGAR
jgi:hypothetical protein